MSLFFFLKVLKPGHAAVRGWLGDVNSSGKLWKEKAPPFSFQSQPSTADEDFPISGPVLPCVVPHQGVQGGTGIWGGFSTPRICGCVGCSPELEEWVGAGGGLHAPCRSTPKSKAGFN